MPGMFKEYNGGVAGTGESIFKMKLQRNQVRSCNGDNELYGLFKKGGKRISMASRRSIIISWSTYCGSKLGLK